MADSFGRSDCPTLAALRGVSVSIHLRLALLDNMGAVCQRQRTLARYVLHKLGAFILMNVAVGFRAKLLGAMGSALYFILPEGEGIALCFPPGTAPDSSKGGRFEKQYEDVLQANAEHYQYLKTKVSDQHIRSGAR